MISTLRDDTLEIVLEGSIDERCPLFKIGVGNAKKIVLNLEKIDYINSMGVKYWILWSVQLPSDLEIHIQKASMAVINQACSVHNLFSPQTVVESFMAPYLCPNCYAESCALVSLRTDYSYATATQKERLEMPTVKCPGCQAVMDADLMVAKVSTFLKSPISLQLRRQA